MEYQSNTLMTAREAASFLHVSLSTLQLIERQGGLTPFRTPGGHRRYSREMVQAYLEASRSHQGQRLIRQQMSFAT
ncbi:MAG: helix-turn-helix domain-containing protein [Anaerolineae bacterium]|nr:helix-turn-helix domain-containing protein [Anaerolineae bacterium]